MKTISWKNATPEQLVLWSYLNDIFDITAIVPLYYQGVIAGSGFESYEATKLYLCLQFQTGTNTPAGSISNISFYDEINNIILQFDSDAVCWDGTAFQYKGSYFSATNFYFSRLQRTNYGYMAFNGYRLTIS